MLMEFQSTSLQVNASQVANWRIEVDYMKSGSFICSISSSQQFSRNYQLRACPLPERNSTRGDQLDLFNSTVVWKRVNGPVCKVAIWSATRVLGSQPVQAHRLPGRAAIHLASHRYSCHDYSRSPRHITPFFLLALLLRQSNAPAMQTAPDDDDQRSQQGAWNQQFHPPCWLCWSSSSGAICKAGASDGWRIRAWWIMK